MTFGQRSWRKAMDQANKRARISGDRQKVKCAAFTRTKYSYYVVYHPVFPVIREKKHS